MKKNNKGFSLVELIVVVLILGILAVAVTPQIMNWINKSKIAKDTSYAGSVATAIESVTLEYVGNNWNSAIVNTMEISGTTPALSGTAGGTTVNPASWTPGPGVTPDFKNYLWDIQEMIGADKLATPEQSGVTKFAITVSPSGTTSTVTVNVVPTN